MKLRTIILVLVTAVSAHAGTLVLKRSWVERYKDRATIEAQFKVDHAHKKANDPKKDGDMHAAGRAETDVGLPMVAEVMNAGVGRPGVPAADFIHSIEGNGKAVRVVGAWRIWFEHPASTTQTQSPTVPIPTNTNPDHCFEIHPISSIGTVDVGASFQPIKGFTPYGAQRAFGEYEGLTLTVSANASSLLLNAKKAGYNYTEFEAELLGTPQPSSDGGRLALANIAGDDDAPVASNVRLVFAPGTRALTDFMAAKAGKGDTVHLIGTFGWINFFC